MEKLANHIALQNIAEGGIEKQALNLGALMRMAKTFASRGKLNHFDNLLAKRQRALDKVYNTRWQKANAADIAANKAYKATNSFGPAHREATRLKNRVPGGNSDLADWRVMDLDSRGIRSPRITKNLLSYPSPASVGSTGIPGANPYATGLAELMGDIRRYQPAAMDEVLNLS